MRTVERPVALAVDLVPVAVVVACILSLGDAAAVMTAIVALAMAGRTAAWWLLVGRPEARSLAPELGLLAIATLLGAANDHLSVVVHRVYDYGLPTLTPGLSSIPTWMLLFWGLILRALATLVRTGPFATPVPRTLVHLPGRTLDAPVLRIAIDLALVLATRQLVYRFHLDPWLSFVPFAAALAVRALLLRLDRGDLGLVATIAIVGPAVEAACINVAHLHRYHLGILGGVPVWIVLWWVLGALVWKELAPRIEALLEGGAGHRAREAARAA